MATSFWPETCATMRIAPVVPVRPSGEVMRMARGEGACGVPELKFGSASARTVPELKFGPT